MIRGVILQHAGKALEPLPAFSGMVFEWESSTTTWELHSGAEEALCSDFAHRGEMAVKSLSLTVDSKLVSRAVQGACGIWER